VDIRPYPTGRLYNLDMDDIAWLNDITGTPGSFLHIRTSYLHPKSVEGKIQEVSRTAGDPDKIRKGIGGTNHIRPSMRYD
jgi:hypothetical protein